MKVRGTVRKQMESAFKAGDLNGVTQAHHANAVQTANRIIEILDSIENASAIELARQIGTTENTVRPALILLEELQILQSVYGPPVKYYKANYYQPSLF